jgi:phosphatidylglycerol---prolipoprotein diacylglyceryl transferase
MASHPQLRLIASVHPFLSLGRLQLPVFGLFAAAGLMAALALGLRTARLAGIDRDALWDTGMVAILSAFVLSRALLVVENLRIFLQYPLLVLELPSITTAGLLLTAIVSFAYLRHRRLPLLRTLDAAAPCAALLAAALGFGRVADGTREGMPTAAHWAIASALGQVHPVELYSAITWLGLCATLLWLLSRRPHAGETVAYGLALGGLLLFVLDFYHLPGELFGNAWLDKTQWQGLACMMAGCAMLAALPRIGEPAAVSQPAARETESTVDAL